MKKQLLIKILLIAISILLLISILPQIILTLFSYPLPGDEYNNCINVKKALNSDNSLITTINVIKDEVSFIYNNWQGSLSGLIFMKLNPVIFSLAFYRFSMFLITMIYVFVIFWSSKVILKDKFGLEKSISLFISSIILFSTYSFTPHPFEFFYWFTGSALYFLTFSLTICFFTLLYILNIRVSKNSSPTALTIILSILAIFFGLNNLPNLMLVFCTLSITLIYCIINKSKLTKYLLWISLFFLISVTINLIAPGNYARANIQGVESLSFVGTILHSFTFGFKYLIKATRLSVVLPMLLLASPLIFKGIKVENNKFINPFLFAAVTFAIYISQYAPVFYSVGYQLMGRIESLRFLSAQFLILINLINIIGYIKQKNLCFVKTKTVYATCFVISAILLSMLVYSYSKYPSTIQIIMSEYKSGKLQIYISEQNQRFDILEDDSINDVKFSSLTYPSVIHHFERLEDDEKGEYIPNLIDFYDKNSLTID